MAEEHIEEAKTPEYYEQMIRELQGDNDELRNYKAILESVVDEDEVMWRALSEDRNEYDLPRDKQYEQMRRAWSAYCTNPMAHRQVDHTTNFTTGEELKFISQIPDLEDWIYDFWNDAQNQMSARIREFANGLYINANVFIRFWVSTETGKVVVREVPPHQIKEIIHDPDDLSTTIYFKREYTKATWNITRYEDKSITEYIPSIDTIRNEKLLTKVKVEANEVNLGIENNLESYIYHFKIPTISNRKWGMPTMGSHLFWLREYKTLLRHITNLNKARSAYVMDVTVEGNATDVENEKKKHKIPPASGSVLVHTNKITYEYKNPSTGAANTAADLRAIKMMIVAGSGMPEHIVTGDASNANFSSTKTTSYPFTKSMQSYQEFWKTAYKYGILFVVLWAGYTYGPLQSHYEIEEWIPSTGQKVKKRKKAIECVEIQFPLIDREEVDKLAAFDRVASEVGFVSKQTLCNMSGFDWRKEKPRIDAENEEMRQLAQQQMEMQAEMQNKMQQDQINPQLAAEQASGEQNIALARAAKDAGVPEASPAAMAATQAMAAGPPMPPGGGGGGSKLMQSTNYPLRTRKLPPSVMKNSLRMRVIENKDLNIETEDDA